MSGRANAPVLRPVLRVLALSLFVGSVLFLHVGSVPPPPAENPAFEGRWTLLEEQSSPVDPWNDLTLEIGVDGSEVTIERIWSSGRFTGTDAMTIRTGGDINRVPFSRWLANRHLGVAVREDPAMQRVKAHWIDDERTLRVISRFDVTISQGKAPVRTYSEYRLSSGGERLTLLEFRSTRPKPLHYVFTRAGAEETEG